MNTETNVVPITRGQSFSLAPTTLREAMDFAKLVADSDLAPKDYKGKPGNVVLAVQWGAELGIAPLQALQNISVINGRPAIWGDLALALVLASPVCEYARDGVDGAEGWCEAKRRGHDPVRRTFSMDDAKRAGLLGKQGPWSQYPQRMLQLRARGFALRDAFPDVLKGVITREEAEDIPVEPRDVTPRNERPAVPPAQVNRRAFAPRPASELPPPKEEPSFEAFGAITMIQALGNGYKPELAERFFGAGVRFKADLDKLKATNEAAYRLGYDQLHAAYNDLKRSAQGEAPATAEPEPEQDVTFTGDVQPPAPAAPTSTSEEHRPAAPAVELHQVGFVKRGKTKKGGDSVGVLLQTPGASRDDKGFWVNAYNEHAAEIAGIAEAAKKAHHLVSIETEELDGGMLVVVSMEAHEPRDGDVPF